MGSPELYAQHAVDCQKRGYKAYKIHPYYFWDPDTGKPDPGRPSHVDWDIACCEAVRDAVGDDMVLMYDPWGTYRTYEDALKVGRVLEELDFYWYEHPMSEYRVDAYVKLAAELDIPILSPEIAPGSIYTRADWILRGASDMSRFDVLRGGITGAHKMAAICEAYGVKLRDAHGGLWQPADPGLHQRGRVRLLRARPRRARAGTTRRRSRTGTRSATRWTPTAMCASRKSRAWATRSTGTTSRAT